MIADFHLEQTQKQFFPRTRSVHKKHDQRELGLFEEKLTYLEILCFCNKTYFCYDNKADNLKFSSKGLSKRALEESGESPMVKDCKSNRRRNKFDLKNY